VLKYAKDRKYKNVVIFSKKGKRPLPDQMAGGDLDGDTYLVIWEPRILDQTDESFNKPASEGLSKEEER